MAVYKISLRLWLAAIALSLPPVLRASSCLDVQWCHCDAQNTLHCQTSDESELRQVASRLAASPRLQLADLVVRGLPSLPGGLFRQAALHGLLLSGSHAERLPDDLLAGLEDSLLALGLGENRLTAVPTEALRPLTRLERLDLSGNRLGRVEADALPPLASLSELNLADNEIERVAPGALTALPQLTSLNLEGNRVSRDWLGGGALARLPNLRTLNLDRNGLGGALTDRFLGGLANLTKLTLAQNNLTSVAPGALSGLPSLRELDLSQNQIDVIGDRSFHSLGRLSTLRLDMNHIVTLPSSGFSGLKALKSLDLSHNFLQSVTSESLVALTNLRELFLRDNDIIFVDGSLFDSLVALKRLDLSENPLHCDCRLRSLANYLAGSRTQLSEADLSQITCITPSHLENAPLARLSPAQLTCEAETVQYEDAEPRPGDASHQIRLEAAALAAGGAGARLRWRVDPALEPYRCNHVFVFETRAGHEQHVASVETGACGRQEADPSRLQMDVRWAEVHAGQPYRFCLVLEQLEGSPSARPTGCSEPVRLAADPQPERGPQPQPQPQPELAAFGANVTAAGRVTVFLRVRHAPARCAVTVRLLDAGRELHRQPMACSLTLLALSAAGRPGLTACVSAPHRAGAAPAGPPPAGEQCVRLRPAAGGRWWQSPAAAVALGCLLAVLLVGAAAAVYCRLHGRCRLRGRYNKWAGRPGVGFVRTASQPRSPSEENIHRDQEETDSQV